MPDIVITVIDFETTGMDPAAGAEVVEVGLCELVRRDGASSWQVYQPTSWLCGVAAMPPQVRAVHHISLAEVAGKPAFHPGMLAALICDGSSPPVADYICAHNWAFEQSFIGEFPRPAICTYKAALRVWPEAPSHSNGALRYWLEDLGKLGDGFVSELAMPAHRAGPDAYVTAWLLKALLEAGATLDDMVRWTAEPRVLPACPIGQQWRGKPWAQVDEGFLRWALRQNDLEPDVRWNFQREMDRRAALRAH